MKKLFFSLVAIAFGSSPFAQTEKGASPLPATATVTTITRAVVIGISDYQDDAIPDLQFAHKDAEAFAAWLHSPGGGSAPLENIQLLLNQKATQAKVAMALTGLMQQSKEGDQAIFYFSGHSDVERITFSQPGFLLCWDSPAQVYYAGGTLQLGMIQEIVTTLSLQNKARVLMITDACHAGKLAGSEVGGPQATAANLAKQFANEVKILSCQPNEFSLEGEQWGGGRGAFSFHLTDGLYGLADRNGDKRITLLELENYLEDRVPAETAPHPQLPFAVGNKTIELARVDTGLLAKIKEGKTGQSPTLENIEPRGMETWVLAQTDSGILELYHAFNAALERKELLQPKEKSANDYYARLIGEPALEPLHGLMTRNFAAALLDESQQVTNKLLKTDPQVVSDVLSRPFVFDHIHAYIARAIELLGERHFLYKHLKAKQLYFEAKTYRKENYPDWSADSLEGTYLRKLEEGLLFDPEAGYIYLELVVYYNFNTNKMDRAIAHGKKAIELSPHCAAAHYFTGAAHMNSAVPVEAIRYLEKAVALDSTFFPTYVFLGIAYGLAGNHEKYLYFLEKYVRSTQELIRLNPDVVPVFYYNQLGNALWKLGRVQEAEAVLLTAEKLSEGQAQNTYFNLVLVYMIAGKWEKAIQAINKTMELSPDFLWLAEPLGFAYRQANQPSKAEEIYKNWIQASAGDTGSTCNAYRMLGDLYLAQGRRAEAESLFQKIIEYYPNPPNALIMNFVGRAQYVLHGLEAMEQTINRFIQATPDNMEGYFQAACLYALAGEETEALEWLKRALVKDSNVSWIMLCDVDLLLIRNTPAFQSFLKQCFPEWGKN